MHKGQCPKCQTALSLAGICDTCGGALMGLAVLNLVSPEGYVKRCLDHVAANGADSERTCPHCTTIMKAVFPPDCEPPLELDFCLNCRAIWFDANEIHRLPKKSAMEKAKMEAVRLEQSAKKRRQQDEEDKAARKKSAARGVMLATILMMR